MSKFIDSLKKHTSKIFASRTAKPQNQASNVNNRQQQQNAPQLPEFYPFVPGNPHLVVLPPPPTMPPPPVFRTPFPGYPAAMPFAPTAQAYQPVFDGPNIPVFNMRNSSPYDAGIRSGLYQEPPFNHGFPVPSIVITDIIDPMQKDSRPEEKGGNDIKITDAHETKKQSDNKTEPMNEKQDAQSPNIPQTPKGEFFIPHYDYPKTNLNDSQTTRPVENVFTNLAPPESENTKPQFQNTAPPSSVPPFPFQLHNPRMDFNVSSNLPKHYNNTRKSFHETDMNFNIPSIPNANNSSTMGVLPNDTVTNAIHTAAFQLPLLNNLTPSQKQTIDALIYTMQRTKDKEAIRLILNEIIKVANPNMKDCLESTNQIDQFEAFKRPLREKTFASANTQHYTNTYSFNNRKEISSKPILYFRCDGIPIDNLALLQCTPVI